MRRILKTRRLLIAAGLFAIALGCNQGPPLGQVSGKVTLDGEPVPQATLTFSHANGRTAFARTDESGAYELKFTDGREGALLGENHVSIETSRAGTDAEGNFVEYPETIPAKYNKESEITKVIEPGEQTIDFDLSSD